MERWCQHVLKHLPQISPLPHLIRAGQLQASRYLQEQMTRPQHMAQTAARIHLRLPGGRTQIHHGRDASCSKRSEGRRGRDLPLQTVEGNRNKRSCRVKRRGRYCKCAKYLTPKLKSLLLLTLIRTLRTSPNQLLPLPLSSSSSNAQAAH